MLGTYKLELTTRDVGNVHVVSGGGEIFILLAGEDVESSKMDLGVTVLAGLGGGHIDNLAWASLDHNVSVLTQGRALHGKGKRRASIGGLEGNVMLQRGGKSARFRKDHSRRRRISNSHHVETAILQRIEQDMRM